MKLFAIYVGGEIAGANIELHDMRFVVASHIDDTHAELRRQWWGRPESLHIDCWSELSQADGYRITLRPEPATHSEKLYYVNVGGYGADSFHELHKNMFMVAQSESKAKVKALKTVRHWKTFHQDDIYEAEQCFCLQKEAEKASLYIHLEKTEDDGPAHFTCGYINVGAAKSK